MDEWRMIEELDKMRDWDADALCDTLNVTSEELIELFLDRAIKWVKENCE